MHRLHCCPVLGADRLNVSFPFAAVAQNPPYKPFVRVGVNKNFNIHQVAQPFVLENKNTLNNYYICRLNGHRFVRPVVNGIVINGAADSLSAFERFKVFNHDVRVKGVRGVVVDFLTLLKGKRVVTFVVIVMIDNADLFGKLLFKLARQGGFSAARAACNSDYYRSHFTSSF